MAQWTRTADVEVDAGFDIGGGIYFHAFDASVSNPFADVPLPKEKKEKKSETKKNGHVRD